MDERLRQLPVWEPDRRNKPQCLAYASLADILLYGGKPYGGKSELILGLARMAHFNSLLLRVSYPELRRGFIPRSKEFFGDADKYYTQQSGWIFPDGRRIEFSYGEKAEDFKKQKGPNRDFIGIDEASEISRFEDGATPIDTLLPWNRTTIANQRVRIVLCSNPGGVGEEWLIEYFRPWLDSKYPNPADIGELRWQIRNSDGVITEVEEGTKGAKSFTYIHSSWVDNPYAEEGYEAQFSLLQEPYRSQLLFGEWGIGAEDDRWQVIPTEWVRSAMDRWKPRTVDHFDSVGVDVSMGGRDETVFIGRTDNWFSTPERHPGKNIKTGKDAADLLSVFLSNKVQPRVVIDSFGPGAECYSYARSFCNAMGFQGQEISDIEDGSGKIRYRNKNAECWGAAYDALNPANGRNLEIPKDQKLLSDLTTARKLPMLAGEVMQIESKEQIIKRLGRSTDTGDAWRMANFGKGSGKNIADKLDLGINAMEVQY